MKIYKIADSKKGGTSYEKLGHESEKDLGKSNITHVALQDEIIGPINVEESRRKLSMKGCWRAYEFTSRLYNF